MGKKKKREKKKTVGVNCFFFNDWPLFPLPPCRLSVSPIVICSAGFRVRQRFGMCFLSELKERETLTQKAMEARNTRSDNNRRSWERKEETKQKVGASCTIIKDASICYRKNEMIKRKREEEMQYCTS